MPAALAPVTASAVPAVPVIAAPLAGAPAAPLEVTIGGFYGSAIHEADDSDLALARIAGISDLELGIGGAVSAPAREDTRPTSAPGVANTILAGSGDVGGEAPSAPVQSAATANTPQSGAATGASTAETKEQRVARLKRELAEAEGEAPTQAQQSQAAGTSASTQQVTSIHGTTVPLAPAGSMGGATIGGVPLSQARIDQAEQRMNSGQATEEDMLVLSAAAV